MANIHLKLFDAVLLVLLFLNYEDGTIPCFTSWGIVMQLWRFLPSRIRLRYANSAYFNCFINALG